LASVDAPRTRRTFARLDKVLDVPNLIDIQKKSFAWLVDPRRGLRETIDDISPIEDYTGNLAVQFGEFTSTARSRRSTSAARRTSRTRAR
jgi:DNA-directed RNA polymerase subunit beta